MIEHAATDELQSRRGAREVTPTPGRRRNYASHVFLLAMAAMWLAPLLWTLYTSLRPKADTDAHGYFSVAGHYGVENYLQAWEQGRFASYLWNSVIITVPTVTLTLLMASAMAFAVSRFSWKFNVSLLILFTAGNLLPQQVLAAPLFAVFKNVSLPYEFSDSGSLLDTYIGVIAVVTACQMGFCTFVLSNYMKALPQTLTEAAVIDGASVWRQYISIILPLCRPALAALLTLQIVWVYNDFFWPLLLIQSGDRLPITTAINNLQGLFFSDYNLLAAGAVITVVPTLLVYLFFQRQFVSGLTLGSDKG